MGFGPDALEQWFQQRADALPSAAAILIQTGSQQSPFRVRPMAVLEEPKSIYLDGFGVVVHAEVNLYPTTILTLFQSPQAMANDLKCEREQKGQRLKQLQTRLRELLLAQSAALSELSADSSLAVVIHFFNARPYPEIPGQIVVQGPPEAMARCKGSFTGEYLREVLGSAKRER